ncbi:MAG: D-alanyl-D-alanine carboxypeptidase/D-alanyl-D-alanine-endopeptidase [Ilumatobacter sp.]|uniref:D-alanyl-D-alanine carboxypeptidase/D-alanyl-D-alanine-endopeptidase n=1 Tax=Ilumatobacter sp. TaxID=1967498 RepID=UPI0039187F80
MSDRHPGHHENREGDPDDGRDASGPAERPRAIGTIDLVAEPIRYPRSPLIALLIIAVVPTFALFALQQWADSEADAYEANREVLASVDDEFGDVFDPDLRGGLDVDGDGVRDEPSTPDDDTDDGAADGAAAEANDADGTFATPLLDYRRAPTAVADLAAARQLGEAVEPVFRFLGAGSCGAVSVDGIDVASVNADGAVIPASVQKLLVGAAAIEILGADYRFATSIAVPAPVDGVVDGDIYLIGGGDPMLTSDDYPIEDDRFPVVAATSLDRLADAVVAAGVSRVRGTVIGDGTRYDDEFVVDGWADGVAGVDAGPYDALVVNDARVRGRSGREDDPNEAAAREFVRLLGDRGVRVDNGWGSGVASTLVPIVGTVESAPLIDIVSEMLLTSDNNTAELLVKELGVAEFESGSRLAGTRAVLESLQRQGLMTDGVTVIDGSGLSVDNRVTCTLVLGLLQRLAGGPLAAALPVAARTGTLTDEFLDSSMAGRLSAKTGTLGNEPFDEDPPAVKSLAGYVSTPDDATIEFVVIANDADVSLETKYRPLWTALGERFETYPSGPDADALGPS